MNLYLLQFNNYYNRQVKRFDTIAEYNSYIIQTITNKNYYPADGVNTTTTVNNMASVPDYAIWTDNNGNIISRWFVIESTLESGKTQFTLTLRRDLVADSKDELMDAPMFIEKAILNADDPMIFNSEDMTYNQIKEEETLLKDETGIGWIVGYIPSDAFENPTTITKTVYTHVNETDFSVAGIENWDYWKYCSNNPSRVIPTHFAQLSVKQIVYHPNILYDTYIDVTHRSLRPEQREKAYIDFPTSQIAYRFGNSTESDVNRIRAYYAATVDNDNLYNQIYATVKVVHGNNENITDVQRQALLQLKNKTIYDSVAQKTYKISVESIIDIQNEISAGTSGTANALYTMLDNLRYGGDGYTTFYPSTSTNTWLKYVYADYIIQLEQVNEKLDVTPDAPVFDPENPGRAERYHLVDQPMDMFCMPYGKMRFKRANDGTIYESLEGEVSLQMAIAIAEQAGSGSVYDIQLLPYCPVREVFSSDINGFFIDLSNTSYNCIYPHGTFNNPRSFCIWASSSNGSFNIPLTVEKITDAVEKKIESETVKYRFCGPNYQSAFDFNPQMNDGLDYVTVSYSYKPFNPYIHVAPHFKGLYSSDNYYSSFNDLRGLTLQGDFSVTQLSNAWANYQQQNVNYQAIFNREIEDMKIQNKYQRVNDIVGAISGTIQGAASGAVSGGMMGGGPGAAVGAVVGGAASLAGGIADVAINDKLRAEAMDYKKDMFGYQLGNIQAIPTALSKVGAFNIDNRIFPFVEKYTCTDYEKNALRNKLKYNGMTVMRIGTINEFIQPEETYIKGRLIRLENFNEDTHYFNSLSDELFKGVFIKDE